MWKLGALPKLSCHHPMSCASFDSIKQAHVGEKTLIVPMSTYGSLKGSRLWVVLGGYTRPNSSEVGTDMNGHANKAIHWWKGYGYPLFLAFGLQSTNFSVGQNIGHSEMTSTPETSNEMRRISMRRLFPRHEHEPPLHKKTADPNPNSTAKTVCILGRN